MSKITNIFLWSSMIVYVLLYTIFLVLIDLDRTTFGIISMSIILIPLIFLLLILLFLVKKDKSNNVKISKNKTMLITTISIVFPIICLFMMGLNEHRMQFTVEKWLTNSQDRSYMVEDFLNHYELVEMNKDEVINLLGRPSKVDDEGNISYFLGDEKGLIPIDDQMLVICFNNNKLVTGYEIITD